MLYTEDSIVIRKPLSSARPQKGDNKDVSHIGMLVSKANTAFFGTLIC